MPIPPQNRTTFTVLLLFPRCAPGIRRTVPESAGSCQDLHFRNRHDELSTPLADIRELRDDLVLQVPRQNQHVIGAGLPDSLGGKDRNMSAGEKPAVLVG